MKVVKKIVAFIITFVILASCFPYVKSVDSPVLSASKINIAPSTSIEKDLVIGQTNSLSVTDVDINQISGSDSKVFCFVSDDGASNDWYYRDTFASRGVACAVPVVAEYLEKDTGDEATITLQQALDLQNNYGYEIGSHSYNHLHLNTLTSSNDLDKQIKGSYSYLNSLGLYVNNFFVPFGDYNDEVLEQASNTYRAIRTSDKGINNPLDCQNLKTNWIDNGALTLAEAKRVVDSAVSSDEGPVIFSFHAMVANENLMNNKIGPLLDYILQQDNTRVMTVNKMLDRAEDVVDSETDYFIDNQGKLVLDKWFLKSLSNGSYEISFTFSDGHSETLTVNTNRPAGKKGNYTPELTDLSITSYPRTSVVQNGTLDLTGLKVCAIGSDGSINELSAADYVVTADTSVLGTQTAIIQYKSLSAEFTYTVLTEEQFKEDTGEPNADNVSSELSEISVTKLPTKRLYYISEPFDSSGMVVKAYFTDDSTAVVTNYTVSGFDSTKEGNVVVTISYKGLSTSFNVTIRKGAAVTDPSETSDLKELSITSLPNILVYEVGEKFDSTGLVVTATYSDSSTKAISDYTISGFDSKSVGKKTVVVSYGGISKSFDVTVKEAEPTADLIDLYITHMPDKKLYYVGESFDPTGLVVKGYFSDDTELEISSYTISGYDSSKEGNVAVNISYKGLSVSFNVTIRKGTAVIDPVETITLKEISVTSLPNKLVYEIGESFDSTGLVVTAIYSDNSTKAISDYTISGFDNISAGNKTVVVNYGGLSKSFDISVKEPEPTADLVDLYVTHMPDKRLYYVGESFDSTGLVVKGYFSDETELEISNYSISGFDSSKEGNVSVTVSYKELSVSFNVTIRKETSVIDPSDTANLKDLIITSLPNKLVYDIGEPFNSSGLVVTGIYSDSSTKVLTNYTISGFNSDIAGKKTIVVGLSGLSKSFEVTVQEVVYLKDIIVTKMPEKLIYEIGEAFSPSGMVVTAIYSDDSTNVISDYTISGFDSTSAGNKTIVVSYSELSKSFDVIVKEPEPTADLIDLYITHMPDKKLYYVGESFDSTGLVVKGYFSDETELEISDYTISGFDSSKEGNVSVTISYKELSTSFNVTIRKGTSSIDPVETVTLKDISITSLPNKLVYDVGEAFDSTGLVVTAIYSDNSTKVVTDYSISGFDSENAGNKTIVVSFNELSKSFEVSVQEVKPSVYLKDVIVTKLPEKFIYEIGETFSSSGMVVTAIYSDDSTLVLTDYTISGFDSTSAGNKTIVVSYSGISKSFDIIVKEPEPTIDLIDLYITHMPEKRVYYVGESFDPTGLVVKGYFSDETELEISNYTISGFDSSKAGEIKLTIGYGGLYVEINVTIRIDKHVHEYTWKYNEENHCKVCTICGIELESGNHKYTNDCDTTCDDCGCVRIVTHKYVEEITKPATETETGIKTYICSICGDKYTEVIPIVIPVIQGDLNGDTKINAIDSNLMSKLILGQYDATEQVIYAADINGDGKVNAIDANLLTSMTVG